ncbi:hypothetical protein ACPC54_29685 [Kitasatospora sp. NPDC094028]
MVWIWTRLTGWLALAGTIAAGYLELGAFSPGPTIAERLRPVLVAALCALLWVAAALATRRTVRPTRRGAGRPFGAALGLAAALVGTAALVPGVGPWGESARWAEQVREAGGRTHEVTVLRVLGTPSPKNVVRGEVRAYAADVEVDVPFVGGARPVTLRDVTIQGQPAVGDRTDAFYAPTRPDLGARPPIEASSGVGVFSNTFGVLLLVGGLCACGTLAWAGGQAGRRLATLRRFRPGLHLPVAAGLAVAAGLDAVVVLTYPPLLVNWALCGAAAVTVGATAGWALRQTGAEGEAP